MDVNTRCCECDHEFPQGDLIYTEEGWGCPKCGSLNVEAKLEVTHQTNPIKKFKPLVPGRVPNIKYEEGQNHD